MRSMCNEKKQKMGQNGGMMNLSARVTTDSLLLTSSATMGQVVVPGRVHLRADLVPTPVLVQFRRP